MAVQFLPDQHHLRRFVRALVRDVEALDRLLHEGRLAAGAMHIGLEQELFLVDRDGQAAPCAAAFAERSRAEGFVPEMGPFNLELGFPPRPFTGSVLRDLEADLEERLSLARQVAADLGADIALLGILPTVRRADLLRTGEVADPIHEALLRSQESVPNRTADFRIFGTDELYMRRDVAMLEAATSSLQLHLQMVPETFARTYNAAQAASAPVLAAAVNAPLLFGRRLWHETRIAALQYAIDTREGTPNLRDIAPRVRFGDDWLRGPVTDLFREDIARFRVMLAVDDPEDALAVLDAGGIPRLDALGIHCRTVFRWNRPVYGVTGGRPHLRIESRLLPSGPTVVDEVANAAFWFGLVRGLAEQTDVTEAMDFDDAKTNFIAAARLGLGAQLCWLDGQTYPAPDLIMDQLLPLAREGLADASVDAADVERYLGLIDQRVRSGQTGAQWQLDAFDAFDEAETRAERLVGVVTSAVRRQRSGVPVHLWSIPDPVSLGRLGRVRTLRVDQVMQTDLFTVEEDEPVELAACLMEWQAQRHMLVEDARHHLVGLIDRGALLRHLTQPRLPGDDPERVAVRDAMIRDLVTVSPDTPVADALSLMAARRIGSLPVVQEGRLVGLVSERSLLGLAARLIEGAE